MIYDIHAVKRRYEIAPEDEPSVLQYLKALKYIIGADGEIADAEWLALERWMQRMYVSKKIMQEIADFDFRTTTLEAILPDLKKDSRRARSLIRDAIEISWADGTFAVEEDLAVQRAAALLGVKATTVKCLESLVEMKAAVHKLQVALLGE